jgi:hypothetical protein
MVLRSPVKAMPGRTRALPVGSNGTIAGLPPICLDALEIPSQKGLEKVHGSLGAESQIDFLSRLSSRHDSTNPYRHWPGSVKLATSGVPFGIIDIDRVNHFGIDCWLL